MLNKLYTLVYSVNLFILFALAAAESEASMAFPTTPAPGNLDLAMTLSLCRVVNFFFDTFSEPQLVHPDNKKMNNRINLTVFIISYYPSSSRKIASTASAGEEALYIGRPMTRKFDPAFMANFGVATRF
jgi:hypothetical protein